MPVRAPRRSLKLEIAVSLAAKAVALAAIGLALFGPGDRVRPDTDAMTHRFIGSSR